ncbi:hypothetical protein [Streptomyces sp. NPDC093269]|uniref:hypothetical protein n=1 Tax=Streptomyces sp. NPDC093269 TaxID=3366038 RepID=UPI003817C4CA
MNSALPGGAAPPHPMRHLETSAEQEDDDALIEKLRARAWDPGMRFERKPADTA